MGDLLAIIGGDLRIINLAKILAKEKNIITFGQELAHGIEEGEKIVKEAKDLKSAVENAKTIIGPIPLSKDGETVHAEFSKNKILLKDLIKYVKGKTLIAGAVPQKIYNLAQANNVKIIDLMKDETLTVLNTIATAEGAVAIAIQRTKRILQGSNVLILGFGRVGKVVAKKFAALNSKVTCAARKLEDFAWMQVCGYNYTNINNLGANLKDYDIIINTAPALILTEERLKYVKKDCLIIDLASKPGGVDVLAAEKLGLNFEWALALPGKVAPITAAKHIKDTLDKVINLEEK